MGSKIISRPLHLNSKIFINRHGFELKSITVRLYYATNLIKMRYAKNPQPLRERITSNVRSGKVFEKEGVSP